jgi:hypothetical protein
VLLKAGLADGLAARLAGQVEATGYSAERDPGTKVVNPQAISDYSPLLANAVVVPAAIRSSVCERPPQAPCHGCHDNQLVDSIKIDHLVSMIHADPMENSTSGHSRCDRSWLVSLSITR